MTDTGLETIRCVHANIRETLSRGRDVSSAGDCFVVSSKGSVEDYSRCR